MELIPCDPDPILIKVHCESCKLQMKIQEFATQIKLQLDLFMLMSSVSLNEHWHHNILIQLSSRNGDL